MNSTTASPEHSKAPCICILAGEESGDMHAAALVKALRQTLPNVGFFGMGGAHLKNEGVHLYSDIARYGVTGLSEVVQHFSEIKRTFRTIQAKLVEYKPDLLILVDYPGFNLRMARYAKKTLGIPVLYYISPQIWAWKAGRIKIIQKYVDHMAVILPFEKAIYRQAEVDVSFVGHPVIHKLPQAVAALSAITKPKVEPINLAFLPGSRQHELDAHWPVMLASLQTLWSVYPHLHVHVPVAKTLCKDALQKRIPAGETRIHLHDGQAIAVANRADCIIVASGTASLECALLCKPMAIIYKTKPLSFAVGMQVAKVRYLGLINLLANRMLIPELIQYDLNPTELIRMVQKLIEDTAYRAYQHTELRTIRDSLCEHSADKQLSDVVLSMLGKALPTGIAEHQGAPVTADPQ